MERGYAHDKRDRVVLEAKEHMKARGLDSPDDGDALALTFAAPVRVPTAPSPYRRRTAFPEVPPGRRGWMS